MSANFTTDLALKDEILPMDELFQYGDQKAGDFLVKAFWPACIKRPGDGHHLCDPVP
jgi:sn-glycerol 3-phosphate transport system substrate-binding protein